MILLSNFYELHSLENQNLGFFALNFGNTVVKWYLSVSDFGLFIDSHIQVCFPEVLLGPLSHLSVGQRFVWTRCLFTCQFYQGGAE